MQCRRGVQRLRHDLSVLSREESREALRDLVRTVRGGSGRARKDALAWLGARSGREWLLLDDNARDSGWVGVIVAGNWLGERVPTSQG